MAALAPIPSASETTAMPVTNGVLKRVRKASVRCRIAYVGSRLASAWQALCHIVQRQECGGGLAAAVRSWDGQSHNRPPFTIGVTSNTTDHSRLPGRR